MDARRRDQAGVRLQRRFGARLRALRKAKGLTQERLSEQTGIAVRHIQKLEAGEANATLHTVAVVALAVDVSPDALLGDDASEKEKA